MITIQDAVRQTVLQDEEVLHAFTHKLLNLSAYAKNIKPTIETLTFKRVGVQAIVVALSRTQKEMKRTETLLQDVVINNISTKSPLSEIVFEKTTQIFSKLAALHKNITTTSDDFLTISISSNEITIICSERLKDRVLKTLQAEPVMIQNNLASLGITFDPKYYELPNVGYSLLRKVAQKRIVLAEIVTTHTEMIFVFHKKDLAAILDVFGDV